VYGFYGNIRSLGSTGYLSTLRETRFFGLMNSDFGYALVDVLAALLILDRFVDDPKSPAFREFKGLVLASNAVVLVTGLLSGCVFRTC